MKYLAFIVWIVIRPLSAGNMPMVYRQRKRHNLQMYVMPLVHPYMLRVRTRLHIHAPSKPFNLAAQHTFGRQYDSDQNYRAFHQIAD